MPGRLALFISFEPSHCKGHGRLTLLLRRRQKKEESPWNSAHRRVGPEFFAHTALQLFWETALLWRWRPRKINSALHCIGIAPKKLVQLFLTINSTHTKMKKKNHKKAKWVQFNDTQGTHIKRLRKTRDCARCSTLGGRTGKMERNTEPHQTNDERQTKPNQPSSPAGPSLSSDMKMMLQDILRRSTVARDTLKYFKILFRTLGQETMHWDVDCFSIGFRTL